MPRTPCLQCPETTLEGVRCKLRTRRGEATCHRHAPYDGTLVNPGVLRCETCRKPWPCPKAGT